MKNLLINVRKITRKAHNEISILTLNIIDLENELENPKYSDEYKKETIAPKLKQAKNDREDVREKAVEETRKLAAEYKASQIALDELRGDQINDDARLLNCGIMLKADELEKIFDRNSGNGTMQQIICRYARDNGMKDFRRTYQNHSSFCHNIDHDLPYTVDVALKYYYDKNAYERIAGEGGLFDQQIAAAE